jgi:F-type H+-transporting ATPase subunit delta
MKEQVVSKAYAQAVYQISEKEKIDITGEFNALTEVINESNDLENLLFLDVFSTEEKVDVLNKILEKLKSSNMFKNFLGFLIQEKRIGLFPLIFKELVIIDDENKGFLRGVIEGSESTVDKALEEKLMTFLSEKLGKKPNLKYVQNENITAGLRVTVQDLQLDASLDNQLDKLKKEIVN